jgi:Uma2 family endonuclease
VVAWKQMPGLSDDEYFAFCQDFSDLRLERTADREIRVMAWEGGESAYRVTEAGCQLFNWAVENGCGKGFGTTVQFLLPDGSAFSPDAAWVSNARLAPLTKKQRRELLPVVPEFVMEVLSPGDRRASVQRKMNAWIANGVDMAWLIDGDNRTVHDYRRNSETRVYSGMDNLLAADGPVRGFVLELQHIWHGL